MGLRFTPGMIHAVWKQWDVPMLEDRSTTSLSLGAINVQFVYGSLPQRVTVSLIIRG